MRLIFRISVVSTRLNDARIWSISQCESALTPAFFSIPRAIFFISLIPIRSSCSASCSAARLPRCRFYSNYILLFHLQPFDLHHQSFPRSLTRYPSRRSRDRPGFLLGVPRAAILPAKMPETPKSVAAVARAIMFAIKDPYARILKVIDQKMGRIVSSGHWILLMKKGDGKQPQGSWRISQSIVIKS
jgi:hypothetical protein